jgi:ferric enterobactin receptor
VRKTGVLILLVLVSWWGHAQHHAVGYVTGNVMDEKNNAVAGATVTFQSIADTPGSRTSITDKNGNFSFTNLTFGYYRLKITYISYQPLSIDSIYLRAERYDFNLNDIILKPNTSDQLEQIVVYAEKPLIQSKDGNITFNAGESPLSAGSNAADLLKSVPLVSSDPDGKVVVKGREPKILIDDKPVELNAQQLQDFLESLPGSMIERIEVMTNPPPQYANEQGGVINIITRKGKVGAGGRLNITGGTRGEWGISGNMNYRKRGLAINLNVGAGYNYITGHGYSKRQNIYKDSVNYFNTTTSNHNRSIRPSARLSIDYDIDPRNIINVLLQFNHNAFRARSEHEYTNLNRFEEIYKLSERYIETEGQSLNPVVNFTYTRKGKKPGETLRFIGGANYSYNQNDRLFFQQFLYPDHMPTGTDSTQQQLNDTWTWGYNARLGYDKLLDNKKTSFSTGVFYSYTGNHVLLNARYLKKPDNSFQTNDLLSNDFTFRQTVSNVRFSVKQIITTGMSIVGGITAEATGIHFGLRDKSTVDNDYLTWLPFLNVNKSWEEKLNLSFAYRKAIRRPGIGNLNPSIDYSDPNNLRFGNPYLEPSISHSFDLVAGRNTQQYYVNLGVGYNIVKAVFSQIRTLQPDGKTNITWQNIDDRFEYEVNTWAGYTFSKKIKLNGSAGYSLNQYSLYDRTKNRYRNGGSFTSSLNTSYVPADVLNINCNITFNRFANPQGTVRSNIRMNFGIQQKLFRKKVIITLNAIDPFFQQQYRSFTYGANYMLESFSNTQTRNFRLTLAYNFTPLAKVKKPVKVKK